MKRTFLFALLAIFVVAIPAAASSPQEVKILVIMPPPGSPPGPGTFTATGPAVDAGIICESGVAVDENINVTGWKKGKGLIWHSRRVFTCDDGGTFTLRLMANIVFDPYENKGNWNVLSGTDDYETLHGAGKLTAYWELPLLIDVFTGKVQ